MHCRVEAGRILVLDTLEEDAMLVVHIEVSVSRERGGLEGPCLPLGQRSMKLNRDPMIISSE